MQQATSHATYEKLPLGEKSIILALSVLLDRIDSLPKADRDDLFELVQELRRAEDQEEKVEIYRAMEEILAQRPLTVRALSFTDAIPLSRGLKAWAERVGKKIRDAREFAHLTQTQLAEKSGLPQSHISRLENAEHSATNMTLEKIAKALGIQVSDLDPGMD